jgi:hydroxyethylthiazole kinase-like uncharacterized protein yjeF
LQVPFLVMGSKLRKMIEIPEDLRLLDRTEIRRISEKYALSCLKEFDPFVHKGKKGHLALVAGSEGMIGAAILSASAAGKAGVGKLTVYVPQNAVLPIHLFLPEAMVKVQQESIDVNTYSAIAIGPGLGTSPQAEKIFKESIKIEKPMVIDADALNLIGLNRKLLDKLPKDAILTPHLLEWQRIFGSASNDKERIVTSIKICNKFKINILIKGHISVFINSEGNIFYNGTGNNGMAKGGSGDVLTGILGSLIAQGYEATNAGILGMYLHGLSGDLANEAIGEDAMTASDQISFLSAAFRSLRNSRAIT